MNRALAWASSRDWLLATLLLGGLIGAGAVSVGWLAPADALLVGFDVGSGTYLALTGWSALTLDAEALRARIRTIDRWRRPWAVLSVGLITISVVVMALVVELKGREGASATAIGLAVVTLAVAWVFFNALFALHYAHLYYRHGGLSFPEDQAPDARDFVYFAFVIGMTFQVSDVAVTQSRMRRHVLIQSLAAFVFNVVIVALSVNMAA